MFTARYSLWNLVLLANALGWMAPLSRGAALPAAFGPVQARLSPDGSRVAMCWQGALATLATAGGDLRVLTRGPGWDTEPAWSPDGRRLAYIEAPNFNSGILRLLDVATGKTAAAPEGIRAQGPLFWHPDGTRLLGLMARSGWPDRLSWLDLKTGELQPLPAGDPNPDIRRRQRLVHAIEPP